MGARWQKITRYRKPQQRREVTSSLHSRPFALLYRPRDVAMRIRAWGNDHISFMSGHGLYETEERSNFVVAPGFMAPPCPAPKALTPPRSERLWRQAAPRAWRDKAWRIAPGFLAPPCPAPKALTPPRPKGCLAPPSRLGVTRLGALHPASWRRPAPPQRLLGPVLKASAPRRPRGLA
jgi:hypothetical protein